MDDRSTSDRRSNKRGASEQTNGGSDDQLDAVTHGRCTQLQTLAHPVPCHGPCATATRCCPAHPRQRHLSTKQIIATDACAHHKQRDTQAHTAAPTDEWGWNCRRALRDHRHRQRQRRQRVAQSPRLRSGSGTQCIASTVQRSNVLDIDGSLTLARRTHSRPVCCSRTAHSIRPSHPPRHPCSHICTRCAAVMGNSVHRAADAPPLPQPLTQPAVATAAQSHGQSAVTPSAPARVSASSTPAAAASGSGAFALAPLPPTASMVGASAAAAAAAPDSYPWMSVLPVIGGSSVLLAAGLAYGVSYSGKQAAKVEVSATRSSSCGCSHHGTTAIHPRSPVNLIIHPPLPICLPLRCCRNTAPSMRSSRLQSRRLRSHQKCKCCKLIAGRVGSMRLANRSRWRQQAWTCNRDATGLTFPCSVLCCWCSFVCRRRLAVRRAFTAFGLGTALCVGFGVASSYSICRYWEVYTVSSSLLSFFFFLVSVACITVFVRV